MKWRSVRTIALEFGAAIGASSFNTGSLGVLA